MRTLPLGAGENALAPHTERPVFELCKDLYVILRDLDLVFVHIPKAAGTSIERALTGREFSASEQADYDVGWGWCPTRRTWLQHATPDEMIALGLLTRADFEAFFSFAIVRNPFDRAVSDFYFLRRHLGFRGSFRDMLLGADSWSALLADPNVPAYRGDHLRQQVDFVRLNGTIALDHIGRLESIENTYRIIEERIGRTLDRQRHKVATTRFKHYSHFYSDDEVELVETKYADDLRTFGYEFEDHRTRHSRRMRPILRAGYSADALPNVGRRAASRAYRRVRRDDNYER